MKYAIYLIIAIIAMTTVVTMQNHFFEKLETILDEHDIGWNITSNLAESGLLRNRIDKNDPLLKNRKIIISSYVNELLAAEIVEKLLYLDLLKTDTIDLYISTNGGFGNCAMSIIETMKILKSKVNTHALGYSYSSGALLLVSGTGKRIGYTNSLIMVHANLDNEGEKYDSLYQNWYEGVFKGRAKLPDDWYPMNRDKSYYLDSEEALNYGIIDTIISN